MPYLVGLDLGQRSDYTALSVIEQRVFTVDVPESEATLAAGIGLSTLSLSNGLMGARAGTSHQPPSASALAAEEEYQQALLDYQWEVDHARQRIERGCPNKVRVDVPRYQGVHLHRYPLGTSYPAIVRDVCKLLRARELDGEVAALVLDATGVGRPVLDLFREAPDVAVPVIGVTITPGDTARCEASGRDFRVPKRDLVAVLSVLMPEPPVEGDADSIPADAPRLVMAGALKLTTLFLAEAHNFKVTLNARGHDSYGAGGVGDGWREGAHDDVVLAVAVPLWYAQRGQALAGETPGAQPPLAGPPIFLGANPRGR